MQSKNLIWIEKGEIDKLKENAELIKLWSEKKTLKTVNLLIVSLKDMRLLRKDKNKL